MTTPRNDAGDALRAKRPSLRGLCQRGASTPLLTHSGKA